MPTCACGQLAQLSGVADAPPARAGGRRTPPQVADRRAAYGRPRKVDTPGLLVPRTRLPAVFTTGPELPEEGAAAARPCLADRTVAAVLTASKANNAVRQGRGTFGFHAPSLLGPVTGSIVWSEASEW